jgi:hypothetical protein
VAQLVQDQGRHSIHSKKSFATASASLCWEAITVALKNAITVYGRYAPAPIGSECAPRSYTDKELVGLLLEFSKKYKRQSLAADCKRGLLPSYRTFQYSSVD